MGSYKYKVHSAIYSCSNNDSPVKSAYDITEKVRELLRNPENKGVLKIGDIIADECGKDAKKTFAMIVTVVYPNDKILTRFCTCDEGSTLDVKESGLVCSF